MDRRRFLAIAGALVALRIAFPLVLLHPAWEFHRDEFLYFAMGDHLSLFGMQFPPLLPAIAAAGKALFGESVLAARVPAALAGGATLAAMLVAVRLLGGGAFALAITTLATIVAPLFLRASVLMHPVVFDQLWCTIALLGVMLAIVRDAPRWWLLTGLAFGLGTLTKFSAPLYGLLVAVAALAVPATRRQLGTRWPWLAAALALALASPAFVGQARTGWPFVEQMAVLRRTQLQHVTSATYLGGQALMLGPAVLLALAGAWATLRGRRASLAHVRLAAAGGGTLDGDASAARLVAAMRVTGTFAALLVSWYLVMHGKEYYAGPAYPMLLASGAAWLERVTVTMRAPGTRTRRLLGRIVLPLAGAAAGAVLVPMGVPCLAPDAMARYAARLGVGTRTNMGGELTLPQDYADMLGWRAQVEAVARVVRALPADDRRRVLIGASNYGQAGALAMHGPSRGLPYPVSTAGDFWRWGHGDNDGNVVLTVETLESRAGLTEAWHEVREVGRLVDPRRVEEERDVRIMLMRGIRIPLPELWRRSGPGWG